MLETTILVNKLNNYCTSLELENANGKDTLVVTATNEGLEVLLTDMNVSNYKLLDMSGSLLKLAGALTGEEFSLYDGGVYVNMNTRGGITKFDPLGICRGFESDTGYILQLGDKRVALKSNYTVDKDYSSFRDLTVLVL